MMGVVVVIKDELESGFPWIASSPSDYGGNWILFFFGFASIFVIKVVFS